MAKKRKASRGSFHADARFAWVQWRMHMRTWVARRAAFLIQMFGMVANDISFVLVWFFFFSSIGTLRGWSFMDMLALQGFGFLGFSTAFFFVTGAAWLPELVPSGKFDALMITPRPLLLRTLTFGNDPSAAGDMLLGASMLVAYGIMTHTLCATVLTTLLLLPAISLIYEGFHLAVHSLTFYFPDNATVISKQLMSSFLSPSIYPAGLFEGFAKFFFTFIIPSLFVAGIPTDILRTHNISLIISIWALGLLWFGIGYLVFHVAVKKYESGNALGMSAE